jgi:hypothetical protein
MTFAMFIRFVRWEREIVVPDVITHRRNSGDNLLVLEAKKVGNPEADAYDRRKLIALKEQQGYRYAVFLRLRTGRENPGIEPVEPTANLRGVWYISQNR